MVQRKGRGLILWALCFFCVVFAGADTAWAANNWEFVIKTPDGTWATGSTENDVGFDGGSLMGERDGDGQTYLDKLLEKYADPSAYWKAVTGDSTHSATITENGSLRLDADIDLYIYKSIAYNSNGAAYSNGRYFSVSFKAVSGDMDLSGLSKMDPLSYVDGFQFSDSESLRGMAADFYRLLMVFASAGMVFSLIVAGIKWAAFGSGAIRQGLAEAIGSKVLAFMAICTFAGLFGLFGKLIETLSKG